MKPSAKIAQGFETQYFRQKNGEVIEGFVTRESGDEVEVRNATGVPVVLKKQDFDRRGKRETSIMPEGLVAQLSPQDLTNLITYLESLKGK
jgi:putative heme-binding domain-containing protein